MRNIKRIIITIVAVIAMAMPASAQFRLGIKAGIDVNSVSLQDLGSNFSSANRTGFTGGLTCEFNVPLIGIGFDLSAMYVHRNNEVDAVNNNSPQLDALFQDENYRRQDFIEIPLNLKYKLDLPAINSLVAPYVTTGPSIAFRCSKDAAIDAYKQRKFDAAWNLGGGLQLFKHLQVGVNYSWGMTKALEHVGVSSEPVNIKNNGWKITAAYYF